MGKLIEHFNSGDGKILMQEDAVITLPEKAYREFFEQLFEIQLALMDLDKESHTDTDDAMKVVDHVAATVCRGDLGLLGIDGKKFMSDVQKANVRRSSENRRDDFVNIAVQIRKRIPAEYFDDNSWASLEYPR
jgi:hypothetical protein